MMVNLGDLESDAADDQKMVGELLDYDGESGARPLNSWEIQFLENINPRATVGRLSARQSNKLIEIWRDIFGG